MFFIVFSSLNYFFILVIFVGIKINFSSFFISEYMVKSIIWYFWCTYISIGCKSSWIYLVSKSRMIILRRYIFSVFWLKLSLLLLWLLLPCEWLLSTVLGFSEVTAGFFTVSIFCSGLITGLTIGFFGASSVVTLIPDAIRFEPIDPIAVLAYVCKFSPVLNYILRSRSWWRYVEIAYRKQIISSFHTSCVSYIYTYSVFFH